ncbi:hypothetical protein GCM10010254_68340 [Streptomyces chromofuscus]|nr:hypothetical protein GCM10010254_68340 [Streptomyces chromofuscus]
MVAFHDEEHQYRYVIVEAPFPVTDDISTRRVHAVTGDPTAGQVQWSGRFIPTGASEDEVVALFSGIHGGGLVALRTAFS